MYNKHSCTNIIFISAIAKTFESNKYNNIGHKVLINCDSRCSYCITECASAITENQTELQLTDSSAPDFTLVWKHPKAEVSWCDCTISLSMCTSSQLFLSEVIEGVLDQSMPLPRFEIANSFVLSGETIPAPLHYTLYSGNLLCEERRKEDDKLVPAGLQAQPGAKQICQTSNAKQICQTNLHCTQLMFATSANFPNYVLHLFHHGVGWG